MYLFLSRTVHVISGKKKKSLAGKDDRIEGRDLITCSTTNEIIQEAPYLESFKTHLIKILFNLFFRQLARLLPD